MSAVQELLSFADEKQRSASDPRTSAWVSASAGSGKTKVLTDRVLSLLLQEVPPERILCITFTKAAAAEMQNRLIARLSEWTTAADDELSDTLKRLLGRRPNDDEHVVARRLFARLLEAPGGLRIMTIHAFCQSVLRRFPLEAGVPPHFEVMNERDAATILDNAQNELFAWLHAGATGPLADALRTVVGFIHERNYPQLLAELSRERERVAALIDDAGGVDPLIARVRQTLGVGEDESIEQAVAQACDDMAFDRVGLGRAVQVLATSSKKDDQRLHNALAAWLAGPARRDELLDSYLLAFLTAPPDLSPRKRLATKGVLTEAPWLDDSLRREQQRLAAFVEQRRKLTTAKATAALLHVVAALFERYERHKAARGLLDYDDLIFRAKRLLERRQSAAWVLFKLDGGVDHLLVDEAQDTNPDQWAVIGALAEEFFAGVGAGDEERFRDRTVFAVGDYKQSIFSFQRADPENFRRMQQVLGRRSRSSDRRWRDVELNMSFRSTRPVLEAVDRVFAEPAARRGVADQTELKHLAHRQGAAGLVEVWPPVEAVRLPDLEPWAVPTDRVSAEDARNRLARLIAARIHGWLDTEEPLPDRSRPIRPGDIMILVRRRGAFAEDMVRALKDRGVPVAGIDRMVLAEQLVVMDLITLGEFLLQQRDDLALAGVLKGPFFGFSEEELFDVCHGRGGSVWAALRLRAEADPRCRDACDTLSGLLRRVDYVGPYELFASLLANGGRRKLLDRLGPEAEDPIDEFLSLALAFERTNVVSLQGFLHWLKAGEAEVIRDLEQGFDRVRVLTVHGSKGLQAPVVILPDTMQMPTDGPRLLWPASNDVVLWPPAKQYRDATCTEAYKAARAAQEDEYRRLLYVAMTRAEDRLYVCGWQMRNKAPAGCWYNMVEQALRDVAQEAPEPALRLNASEEVPVVLRLTQEQFDPVQPYEPAREPDSGAIPRWASEPAPPEPVPPRPLAPSHLVRGGPPARSPAGPADPALAARGRLIHRLLEVLPDVPAGAPRDATAQRLVARERAALDEAAAQALIDEVTAILDATAFATVFQPGSLAEVPISGLVNGRAGEPIVVSGQIDRLVVTDDEVLVVDFKSHRQAPKSVEATPEAYLRQMAAYRALLTQVYPERRIVAALLWTEGPVLARLPDALLDPFQDLSRGGESGPGAA